MAVTESHDTGPVAGFPRRDALELAAALAGAVAADAGARALLVKGPSLDYHRLRPPRESADVDLLIEPARLDAVVDALMVRGWHLRFARQPVMIMPRHAVTLVHDRWPCDLDLHHYFPGAFADPQAAFEAMWRRRRPILLAHREVEIGDLACSAMIGLLHAVRHPRSERHERELDAILARMRAASPTQRADLIALATECQALPVLHEHLSELGDLPEQEIDPRVMSRWRLYVDTHDGGATAAWLIEALRTTGIGRLRVLWYACYPSRADLDGLHPGVSSLDATVSGCGGNAGARGVRALRPAVRAVRRARASRRLAGRSGWPGDPGSDEELG